MAGVSRTVEKTDAMALLTQTAIGPKWCSIIAAACSTASASATSHGIAIASPPRSCTSRLAASSPSIPRAIRPMRAPSLAKRRAVARPTPADAPVITTTSDIDERPPLTGRVRAWRPPSGARACGLRADTLSPFALLEILVVLEVLRILELLVVFFAEASGDLLIADTGG